MLHCISQISLTLSVVQRIADGDVVVLMSETVWAAHRGHQDNGLLQALQQKSCRVFVLQDLLHAFGIDPIQLSTSVESIDYAAFVKLTEQHPQIVTWC